SQSKVPRLQARPALLGLISFCDTRPIKPLLGRSKTLQPWNLRTQIDVFPFCVKTRRLEFIHSAEKVVNKARNAAIPIRVGTPVVRGEDGGYSNRRDPLSFADYVPIIGEIKIRG